MSTADTPKSKRILAFDLMRGYFMLSIILNHLYWYPNGLDWVAARGGLFVTAAEGFFLLSGIVLGTVRGRKLIDKPFRLAAGLLVKRSVQLYITSVVLMLLFTLLGWWFFMDNPGLKAGIRPIDEPFWQVLIGALNFNYLYGWADFLRLYCLFILASPLALWLLRKGKWYVVLIISVAVWSLFPFIAENSTKTTELLMPITWQLIFFSGFIMGFHWQEIVNWWQSLTDGIRRSVITLIVSLAAVTIVTNALQAFSVHLPYAIDPSWHAFYSFLMPFFSKEALPLARLLLFSVWFAAGLWFFMRFEKRIIQLAGWILLPFGANSLYVYIIHAVLIFFAHLLIPPLQQTLLSNIIGSTLILAVILLAVRTKFLMKIIPR